MKAVARRTVGCGGVFVGMAVLFAQTQAQDWPQWRGANRDGVADKSPALIESLPPTGPKMMWEYALPPGDKGNPYYTSPVVAGEKAYIHVPAPVYETLPPDSTNKPKQTGVSDILVAVNMADGKEAWRCTQPGVRGNVGAPNTPCVKDGKLFFIGTSGNLFCIDAAAGTEMWKTNLALRGGTFSSSILIADDKLIVADGKLLAFDIKTGSKLWENPIPALHNSPNIWRNQGKTYILAGQGNQKKKEMWKTFCVDAADGKTQWEAAGGINASPVVSGDTLAMLYWETGLKVYKMGATGATEVASVPFKTDDNQSCTPALGGNMVYGFAGNDGFCYDFEKKDFAWTNRVGAKGCSPILADGKIIQFAGSSLLMFDAATGKNLTEGKKSASVAIVGHSSPALSNGRLVVNAGTHLRCYDLRKAQ